MLGDVVRVARTMPMKGANLGANSESDMIANLLTNDYFECREESQSFKQLS